jgi:methyl-accepting chemotaxis protein
MAGTVEIGADGKETFQFGQGGTIDLALEIHHGHVQQSTADAVHQMDAAKARVDKTTELAGGAGGVLTQIVSASDRIADMVRSIATAAEQQSATSEEININVSGINELSAQMSRDIQQANERIREVADMSRALARLVEKFRSEE